MTQAVDSMERDWSDTSGSERNWKTLLAMAGLLAVAASFWYDYSVVPSGDPLPVVGYELTRLDWLWVASLWLGTVYTVVPTVENPGATVAFLRRLAARPRGFLAGCFVAVVFFVGTVGPLFVPQPTPDFLMQNQPPAFTKIPEKVLSSCLNTVGAACYGTLAHPLGTTAAGEDMLHVIVVGARIVIKLATVSVALIVPVGTAIGTVSAYLGGTTDRVLTGVSETVKTIPALLVYLVWRWVAGDGSLFVLVVTFGLFSWGTVASVVRSRALNEVSKNYVRSAEIGGASTTQIVRWHLIPNVARSAVSTALYQVPVFVTVEATLSFLHFGTPPSPLLITGTGHTSWGTMIGKNVEVFDPFWWRVLVPVVALCLTVFALSLFANTVQSILDPRSNS
jgi:peptide/nickel transport system permease protein